MDRKTNGQMDRQTASKTDRWKNRTVRQLGRQIKRQMVRFTDGQTNTKTDRWIGRKTDTQLNGLTDGQTKRHIIIHSPSLY